MSWKFAAAVFFVLLSSQAAWSQSIFEDRNGNGVFDGSDVDLTTVVNPPGGASTYIASHAVVIAGPVTQRCDYCGGISIESAKRITVNAGVTVASKGKGGTIALHGAEVVLGTKATLAAIEGVYLIGTNQLSIGD